MLEWLILACVCSRLELAARDWADYARRQPAESELRQNYVAFLKERYSYTIGRVNEAYGLEAASFTDLTAIDFRPLDRTRAAVADDDKEFGAAWASLTRAVCSAAHQ